MLLKQWFGHYDKIKGKTSSHVNVWLGDGGGERYGVSLMGGGGGGCKKTTGHQLDD